MNEKNEQPLEPLTRSWLEVISDDHKTRAQVAIIMLHRGTPEQQQEAAKFFGLAAMAPKK